DLVRVEREDLLRGRRGLYDLGGVEREDFVARRGRLRRRGGHGGLRLRGRRDRLRGLGGRDLVRVEGEDFFRLSAAPFGIGGRLRRVEREDFGRRDLGRLLRGFRRGRGGWGGFGGDERDRVLGLLRLRHRGDRLRRAGGVSPPMRWRRRGTPGGVDRERDLRLGRSRRGGCGRFWRRCG